ncbi:2,3-bisphosphoglycerate-independent phosphoglycerate mutase [Candidatus Dojkabacteria bacterium]|uniref:2,3-bisphosphoglycerate-independent phosphoglycerate mutase n=1 Tax=Candidatus Dojkabacteria bacterium TaxID=2099670 RepID=A0A955HY80_9BACT|nr:2,3-bisphosphoglycerate-independent phosphoglycerate mutase [Candidatus Dojkabacteria bacterium]MCB9790506.1 2,3-bisphosphoglycerate-independent phosphoglycerate mutase [Candidatus Nomurabacteria bacterium]
MFNKIFSLFKIGLFKESEPLKIRKDLVTLIVLDGFGIYPDPLGNSIVQAKTPFLDTIWSKGHSTLLYASGTHVGLPEGEFGNSEVGHLNMGSGQVVYQSLPRINDAIKSGRFDKNPVLRKTFEEVKKRGTDLHLMGILSNGGVHGHINHLFALMEICKKEEISPMIHIFLDGRDTNYNLGKSFVEELLNKITELGIGRIASISGRWYAMDRDRKWDRTEVAYNAMVGNTDKVISDPLKAVQDAYDAGLNDETFYPVAVSDREGELIGPIREDDVVLFYNFREDRARQITKSFVLKNFSYFHTDQNVKNLYFVTMTGYEDGLPTKVIFPPKKIEESLARIISAKELNQFHISETEKYMHVTYFLNGGIEDPHPGEDFFNVPSPNVPNYADTPKMSAQETTDELVDRLKKNHQFKYSFAIINYANPDMLGHTGDLKSTIQANEFVDNCVERVVTETLNQGGCAIITADHGNCETMIDRDTGEVNTYHTGNPVPFIIVESLDQIRLKKNDSICKIGTGREAPVTGMLADVAPTILAILGIDKPESMSGLDLLKVL